MDVWDTKKVWAETESPFSVFWRKEDVVQSPTLGTQAQTVMGVILICNKQLLNYWISISYGCWHWRSQTLLNGRYFHQNCKTNKHTESKSEYIFTAFRSLSKNMLFSRQHLTARNSNQDSYSIQSWMWAMTFFFYLTWKYGNLSYSLCGCFLCFSSITFILEGYLQRMGQNIRGRREDDLLPPLRYDRGRW